MSKDRVEDLRQQIADLKKRWPSHSVPPAMMAQLDDLEDELSNELKRQAESNQDTGKGLQFYRFHAIGFVENEFDQPAAPKEIAAVESRLRIDPSLAEGLQGLAVGQQILVIFCFHRSQGFALIQHPRGDPKSPPKGVFALRSPNRPNPIGVTAVEIVGIQENVLRVRGLDAMNGSPVLDLKPA